MYKYWILLFIITFTLIGDYALKSASQKSSPLVSLGFVGGAFLYGATAIGWVALMQTHNLAQIAVLYSAVTIIALSAMGVLLFGEIISSKQMLGILAALLAVLLVEAEA